MTPLPPVRPSGGEAEGRRSRAAAVSFKKAIKRRVLPLRGRLLSALPRSEGAGEHADARRSLANGETQFAPARPQARRELGVLTPGKLGLLAGQQHRNARYQKGNAR